MNKLIFVLGMVLIGSTVTWGANPPNNPITQIRRVLSSSSVAPGWTELVASLGNTVSFIDVVNLSPQGTIALGVGAAGAEGTVLIINAGAQRVIPISIGKGLRVSASSVAGTLVTGELILNFLGNPVQ